MYNSLEDVPDALLRRVMDYTAAAVNLCTIGRNDWRIPALIADQWLLQGFGTVDTNAFARRYSTTRKTVCLSVRRLTASGIIRPVGRTPDGKTKFEPVFEIVDNCQAANRVYADAT